MITWEETWYIYWKSWTPNVLLWILVLPKGRQFLSDFLRLYKLSFPFFSIFILHFIIGFLIHISSSISPPPYIHYLPMSGTPGLRLEPPTLYSFLQGRKFRLLRPQPLGQRGVSPCKNLKNKSYVSTLFGAGELQFIYVVYPIWTQKIDWHRWFEKKRCIFRSKQRKTKFSLQKK